VTVLREIRWETEQSSPDQKTRKHARTEQEKTKDDEKKYISPIFTAEQNNFIYHLTFRSKILRAWPPG